MLFSRLRCRTFNVLVAKMSCVTPEEYTLIIKRQEVLDFCARCMRKVDVPANHCKALAEVLVTEMYVLDIESGICDSKTEPSLDKETVSTALVNGKNLLGPVVGNFAMNIAISKAKETGIAWVAAHGMLISLGLCFHYVLFTFRFQSLWNRWMVQFDGSKTRPDRELLLQEEMMDILFKGMSFTNTSPLVFATRSKKRILGTNPLTVAAPSSRPGDEFVLDMATSAVALGKLEMSRRRGLDIPMGWGADESGKSTSDATVAIEKGALMPLGGEEHTSGYKGSGLSMMVELFCGIMSGSTYGSNIRSWMKTERPADLGQGFVAIDPTVFAPGFGERLTDYMDTIRGLPRTDEDAPVLVPGDPERVHMAECESIGGIRYPPVLIDSMNRLADRLKVDRMPIFKTL